MLQPRHFSSIMVSSFIIHHLSNSSVVKDCLMDIEGTYTLHASPEDVWQSLMDRQVLLRTVPGIEQLEQLDKDTYAIAMHMKQASLIGTYHGHVTVTEQHYPYHYRLIIDVEGR